MKIVIVVSSFGYGHITRQIALKDALLELKSDLEILFVISEKQYEIFHSEILTSDQVSYALMPITPTIVMEDNYSVDIESTKEIFSRFWEWETQIRNDRAWDEILYGSQLVISDIESVHHPIVKKMDIPIINISNFTWSDILMGLGLDELSHNYSSLEKLSNLNLKLPMSTNCQSFSNPQLMGLLVRNFDYNLITDIISTYQHFVVIIGHLEFIPIKIDSLFSSLINLGYKILIVDNLDYKNSDPNIIRISSKTPKFHNIIAASKFVISKLGYGVVSEVAVSNSNLIYWKRSNFIEDIYIEEFVKTHNLGIELGQNVELFIKSIEDFPKRNNSNLHRSNLDIAKFILSYSL